MNGAGRGGADTCCPPVNQGVLTASDGETLIPLLTQCGRAGGSVRQGQLWMQSWSLEESKDYATIMGASLHGAQVRAQ